MTGLLLIVCAPFSISPPTGNGMQLIFSPSYSCVLFTPSPLLFFLPCSHTLSHLFMLKSKFLFSVWLDFDGSHSWPQFTITCICTVYKSSIHVYKNIYIYEHSESQKKGCDWLALLRIWAAEFNRCWTTFNWTRHLTAAPCRHAQPQSEQTNVQTTTNVVK